MKKKIFLTSALAMGFVAPAFAAPSHTDAFPDDGYMQEDYTYTNAATADNMDDVYEGTVNAVAEYDVINYILSAGQYLPADSDVKTTCPAGSFCAGGTFQYDEDSDQGLTSCPTIGGADFTSASGSSAVTACYQDSEMSSAELNPFETAHLNTSKNTDGYINGVKYANATTTARRYATSATTAGEWAALDESDLAITDLACVNGYHYKAGTTAPNLTSLIGITEAGDGYTSNDSNGDDYDTDNMDNTIIANDPLVFAVDYGDKGIIKGHGRCSTRAGTNPWLPDFSTYNVYPENFVSSLIDETSRTGAKYCYCQLDSYTPAGGSATALSAPWVFNDDNGGADDCANDCASFCATYMQGGYSDNLAFRAALFGAVQSSPAMCEANTITINWSNASATDIATNNAGTTTYGSDVRTPVKAETIKGKTFKGWKFSKPEQTTTGGSN